MGRSRNRSCCARGARDKRARELYTHIYTYIRAIYLRPDRRHCRWLFQTNVARACRGFLSLLSFCTVCLSLSGPALSHPLARARCHTLLLHEEERTREKSCGSIIRLVSLLARAYAVVCVYMRTLSGWPRTSTVKLSSF